MFEQDFETVAEGIYPFVVGNTEGVAENRIHLSERNDPYTQKGWADKKLVDDVIDGDWSLKVNTGESGLVYRTIPQNFYFEPGEEYKVRFDYQTTSDDYRFISGDKEIDVKDIDEANGINSNKSLDASTDTKTAEFTITGSKNDQTYIGIFNDGTEVDMDTGEGTFILDNLKIEKVATDSPELEVGDIRAIVEDGEESDAFDEDVAHGLKTHLKAVAQFEKKEKDEKVVKHLQSFQQLLDQQKQFIDDEVYDDLSENTDQLLDQWK